MIFSKIAKAVSFFAIIYFLNFFGTFLMNYSQDHSDKELTVNQVEDKLETKQETQTASFDEEVKKLEKLIYKYKTKKNYLLDINQKRYYELSMITDFYTKRFDDYSFSLTMGESKKLNILALGLDQEYHISNYFLEGYAPFKTSNIYIPLMTIGKKKTYQLDHLGKLKKKEIWQTSKEAYTLPRGDCEDHAIILADWLISNGEDARVAIGKYKNGGHAWVVLFKDNKQYIIEATAKKSFTKAYEQSKYNPNYKPVAMFNRNYFWHNKGSEFTTNYTGNNWVKKSAYIKN